MRVVIQRVNFAKVEINNSVYSEITKGLLILVGIEQTDDETDIQWLAKKIINLRIFNDEQGKLNKSLIDVNGEIMVVSQFTLHASTKKGTRPSYSKAASPDKAIPLYKKFIEEIKKTYAKDIKTGIFGAYMKITLENDGPVTIIIDSKHKE